MTRFRAHSDLWSILAGQTQVKRGLTETNHDQYCKLRHCTSLATELSVLVHAIDAEWPHSRPKPVTRHTCTPAHRVSTPTTTESSDGLCPWSHFSLQYTYLVGLNRSLSTNRPQLLLRVNCPGVSIVRQIKFRWSVVDSSLLSQRFLAMW